MARTRRKPVQQGPLLDDSMFEVDKHGLPYPHFAVQETALAFFGRSPDWLRWRYRPDKVAEGEEPRFPHGYFIYQGEPLEPKTKDSGARYYTLADIERMAFALYSTEVIDSMQLACVLNIVYANAYLHGLLTEPIFYAAR